MSMATIKAIEANSVHQIQSGQVIVDFCSVAKELVENSIDAGATSIEVRFKNNGLDLIEVQDNGHGIAPESYERIALKHYTSKLSSFEDLSRLHTFGFRGEALSSLCALSDFRIVTAQANQAPKANKLEFEPSGKLKNKQIVAGQRGTTVSVENLFKKLPVRRRELEKNIKREYGKVLNLLHAYACISTGARFSVKNTAGKNRNAVVFATNANQTTKENIANVYGAKTLSALISLDLVLDFESSSAVTRRTAADGDDDDDESNGKIFVRGHISRPVFGEGRQTPDRQMFFVNSRPCGLPQIAKAFNEVYKSFNVSQSPFIFADFHMDTNSYDVNVSPDKRTILLHDAGTLIEALKTSLTQLFENSDQTVPQSQVLGLKQPAIKQQLLREASSQATAEPIQKSSKLDADVKSEGSHDSPDEEESSQQLHAQNRLKNFLSGHSNRHELSSSPIPGSRITQDIPDSLPAIPDTSAKMVGSSRQDSDLDSGTGREMDRDDEGPVEQAAEEDTQPAPNMTPPSSCPKEHQPDEQAETPNTIQNAFDRMRPKRLPAEVATITVGSRTVTSVVGSGASRKRSAEPTDTIGSASTRQPKRRAHAPYSKIFSQFAAPGSQVADASADDSEREMDDVDDGRSEDEGSVSQSSVDGQSIPSPANAKKDGNLSDNDTNNDNNNAVVGDDDNMGVDDNGQLSVAPADNEVNEEKKRADEEAIVQQLIRNAEQEANLPENHSINRANKLNKGGVHRDSTIQLIGTVDGSLSRIQRQLEKLQENLQLPLTDWEERKAEAERRSTISQGTATAAEDRLSLTVTKGDFDRMRIIGQFNLGFILATRSRAKPHPHPQLPDNDSTRVNKNGDDDDELFIIDQHASDEKFNFERLQSETVVQNQRLVQPKTLDLTAVEEEIVVENQMALEKNGFVIEIDDSGDQPIGRRCKLVSLPLSKEVVFGIRDLEELIVLLSESPSTATNNTMTTMPQLSSSSSTTATDAHIPRPSKVQKMFAMRACRSSIMVGKNLTQKQMEKVVRNMGTIDKPWNCPHGRPTMRHLISLRGWNELDEFGGDAGNKDDSEDGDDGLNVWRRYFEEMDESKSSSEEEEEEEE